MTPQGQIASRDDEDHPKLRIMPYADYRPPQSAHDPGTLSGLNALQAGQDPAGPMGNKAFGSAARTRAAMTQPNILKPSAADSSYVYGAKSY